MTEYVAASVDWEGRERLEHVARALDPTTVGLLERLGVAPGWKCAEIGAGAGTVAAWLHDRVGPDGHVLATDVETRWLEQLECPGLEIRRHDIGAEGIGEGVYDLVHCRWVLLHVGDWRKALHHMVAGLKPGGWLVVEDTDWVGAGTVYPPCEAVERMWAAFSTLVESGGGHVTLGRELVAAFREAGLVEIDGSAAPILGGFRSELLPIAEPMVPIAVAAGLVSAEDGDEALAFLKDPANFAIGLLMIAMQGRKAS